MGVITLKDIDYGQIFGPFPTHLSAIDPAYLIGMLTRDKHSDGPVLKVDVEDNRDGIKAVDWLARVSAARNEEEQNMEAYLKYGRVYYRTLRILKAGEQLLVWYSKDFTQILGIPELQTSCKQDDHQYRCTHCGVLFDFPFPLRAHLKFQCSFTTGHDLIRIFSTSKDNLSSNSAFLHGMDSDDICSNSALLHGMDSEDICSNSALLHGMDSDDICEDTTQDKSQRVPNYTKNKTKRQLISDDGGKFQAKKGFTTNLKPRKVASLSHSIDDLVGKRASQRVREKGVESLSDLGSAFRKVEKPHNTNLGDNASCAVSLSSFSTISKTVCSPARTSSPQPVTPTSMSAALSDPSSFVAQLAHIPHLTSPLKDQPSVLSMSSQTCPIIKPLTSAVASLVHANPSLSVTPRMGLFMPRIPLMPHAPPFAVHGASLLSAVGSAERSIQAHHSAYADQIPPGLLEMCRATIPSVGPLTESFAANIRNNDTLAKTALFADRHISSLAFLKSTNPMVEKLLQCTNPTLLSSPVNALNLSQNWCAKCNATFRMTSDLVYHMRSHHKRDFDPIKRKREEKLKCSICNEAFRERHHLTRHMSSHA